MSSGLNARCPTPDLLKEILDLLQLMPPRLKSGMAAEWLIP
jgi:hypothetical protein